MNQKLLLITDRDLGIVSKGNIVRIRNLIKAFSLMNYDIALICAALSIHDELRKLCKEIISVPYWLESGRVEDFSPDPFINATLKIHTIFKPDIVITEYAWMASCLDCIQSPVIKAVDTHDLLHEHSQQYTDAGLSPWVTCSPEEEKRLLAKADVVIAIQEAERQKLKELLPDKRIICIPHLGEIQQRPAEDKEQDQQPVIGFIGSAHAGNRGILQFIEHAWPLIQQEVAGSKLLIGGPAGNWVEEKGNIQVIPYVDDLSSFYHSATLIICPVTMGTGLKIKLVEAMLYGKAVVATPGSVEGLPASQLIPYAVADNWIEFSQKTIRLINDSSLRKKMEADAYKYADEHFSFQAGVKKIRELFG